MQKRFKASEIAAMSKRAGISLTTKAGVLKAKDREFPHTKWNDLAGMFEFTRSDVREFFLRHGHSLEEIENEWEGKQDGR